MAILTIPLSILCWLLLVSIVKNDIKIHRGHYPSVYCELTDVFLRVEDHKFYYKSSNSGDIQRCTGVKDVWPLEDLAMSHNLTYDCNVLFDVGHIFTIYYYYGSNYFHLHYDMLIPLYLAVYHQTDNQLSHAFLPTVETTRLQAMDWNTPAFTSDSKYWVQMVKALVGGHEYLPLDNRTENNKLTACFQKAFFGTPAVNYSNKHLIQGFVRHIQEALNITEGIDVKHHIGIITRLRNRRILNEDDLLSAVGHVAPTDRIDFIGMTFRDQVALMQTYTILIGMNGAGLTNGLYLPPGGVVIQLVPSTLQLNNREFGNLLQGGAGGGYLEWINTDEHKTVNRGGDTFVDIDEIVELARKAVSMYDMSRPKEHFDKEL